MLQFAEKGSLQEFLQAHGTSTIAELTGGSMVRIARDVCAGLAYLQRNKFIHRDVAARNVLIFSDWTCKLADLGTDEWGWVSPLLSSTLSSGQIMPLSRRTVGFPPHVDTHILFSCLGPHFKTRQG